jgi:filamentous hemagglutinin family protein
LKTRLSDKKSLSAALLLTLVPFLLFPGEPAYALPENPQVISGEATFEKVNDQTLQIRASDRSIIEYSSFNIGLGEMVQFLQPSAEAFSLNRVTGGSGTEIFGSLLANGNLILVDSQGILFGSSAQVNVGGLIASALDIRNQDFLAGRYVFGGTEIPSEGLSQVVNQGEIRADEEGFVILLGGAVANEGVIRAPLGTVALASGEMVEVGVSGDGLVSIAIEKGVAHEILDAEGRPITEQIRAGGTIEANGGYVTLQADAAREIFHRAINLTGHVQADSVELRNGVIELVASGPSEISGTISAGEVKFGGPGEVYIRGSHTFNDFTVTEPGKSIYFEAGETQTILGAWTVQGAYGEHVRLISTEPGSYWYVNPEGLRDISYAWVEDAYNISPDIIVMTESTNRGGSFNWDPTGTWTNGNSTGIWSDSGNWSGLGGAVPGAGDDVLFDGTSTADSSIDAFGGAITNFTVAAGYTGTINFATTLTASGNYSQANGTVNLGSQTFNVNGNFALSGGSFNGGTGDLNVDGMVTISGGTLTAPDSTGSFLVGDDFTNSAGIAAFVHNGGTLTFDGAAGTQLFDTGGSTYFNVVHSGAGALTMVADGSSATIELPIANDLTQSAGTFNALSADITVTNDFNVTGGTYNADSSRFRVRGDFIVAAPGVFNEGTSFLALGSTILPIAGVLDVNGTETFFDLGFLGGVRTIGAGDTIIVTNALALVGGSINGGTIRYRGDSSIDPDAKLQQSSLFGGGTSLLVIDGSGTQTFEGLATATSGSLPDLLIDKPSGTLTLTGTIRTTNDWTYNMGTVIPGTSTVVFAGPLNLDGTGAGGTMSFNDVIIRPGTTTLTGDVAVDGDLSIIGTLDTSTFDLTVLGLTTISGGTLMGGLGFISLNDLTLSSGAFNGSGSLVVINGDTNLNGGTFTAPSVAGGLFVLGDWTNNLGATFLHNSALIVFDGTSPQNIDHSSGSPFNDVELSNPTSIDFTGSFSADGTVMQTTGTVDTNGNTVTIVGTLDLTGGTFNAGGGTNLSTGDVTIGAAATLNAPGGSGSFSVTGDFINSGTFNPGGGTVTFLGDGNNLTSETIDAGFNNVLVNATNPADDFTAGGGFSFTGTCVVISGIFLGCGLPPVPGPAPIPPLETGILDFESFFQRGLESLMDWIIAPETFAETVAPPAEIVNNFEDNPFLYVGTESGALRAPQSQIRVWEGVVYVLCYDAATDRWKQCLEIKAGKKARVHWKEKTKEPLPLGPAEISPKTALV